MTILSSKYFKYIYYNALQFSQKKGDLFLRSPKSGGRGNLYCQDYALLV